MAHQVNPVASGCFDAFVRWYGEIPPEAQPIPNEEIAQRGAALIRDRFQARDFEFHGRPVGYRLGERWWIVVFERAEQGSAPRNAENWSIQGFAQDGHYWGSDYWYWPAENRWRHFLYEFRGDGYGRYELSLPPLPR